MLKCLLVRSSSSSHLCCPYEGSGLLLLLQHDLLLTLLHVHSVMELTRLVLTFLEEILDLGARSVIVRRLRASAGMSRMIYAIRKKKTYLIRRFGEYPELEP